MRLEIRDGIIIKYSITVSALLSSYAISVFFIKSIRIDPNRSYYYIHKEKKEYIDIISKHNIHESVNN